MSGKRGRPLKDQAPPEVESTEQIQKNNQEVAQEVGNSVIQMSEEVEAEVNSKYFNINEEGKKASPTFQETIFLPYEGKDRLPKAETKIKIHEGKAKFVIVKVGEPRYFIRRCPNEIYKLVKVFSNGKGTAQRHVMTLKPRAKNEKGQRHRGILKKLRKAGIPGA